MKKTTPTLGLFTKLKEWIKVIQTALVIGGIFEFILVVLIGIAASNLYSPTWSILIWVFGVLYVFLRFVNFAHQIKFPSSIIEELKSKYELESNRILFQRQESIYSCLSKAVSSLNNQTCHVHSSVEENFCEQELRQGLIGLLDCVINYTDVIYNSPYQKQYTIGCFLEGYWDYELKDYKNGVLLLKDVLELKEFLPTDLMDKPDCKDAMFELKTAIDRTFQNGKDAVHKFFITDSDLSIRTFPIYEACSNDSLMGVLFIISDSNNLPPGDISDIISIYNRLIANYISRYDECAYQHQKSDKQNNE